MLVRCCCNPQKILGDLPTPNRTRPGFKHTFVTTDGKFVELEVAAYVDAATPHVTLCFKSGNHTLRTMRTIGGFHEHK